MNGNEIFNRNHRFLTCKLTRPVVQWLTLLIFVSLHISLHAETNNDNNKLEFALIGDMPYDSQQRKEFLNMMKEIDTANLAFVIHAGDLWFDGIAWNKNSQGLAPCSDAVFKDRLELFNQSKHPFILVPGDNDWTDCHRAKPHAYDPLERLNKLRKMFFSGNRSLGKNTIKLTRQSQDPKYTSYPENVRWTQHDVMFVTLHMVGSNNNLGRTSKMDMEYTKRNAANLEWMRMAFELAKKNNNKAIMIIAHANPGFENTWSAKLQKRYMLGGLGIKPPKERRMTGFDDFLTDLEEETMAFAKPVLYVHGDTHTFRVDKPLISSFSKRIIENFTRVEVFGYKNTHWVQVTIDPNDPNVFSFHQAIVEENLASH